MGYPLPIKNRSAIMQTTREREAGRRRGKGRRHFFLVSFTGEERVRQMAAQIVGVVVAVKVVGEVVMVKVVGRSTRVRKLLLLLDLLCIM